VRGRTAAPWGGWRASYDLDVPAWARLTSRPSRLAPQRGGYARAPRASCASARSATSSPCTLVASKTSISSRAWKASSSSRCASTACRTRGPAPTRLAGARVADGEGRGADASRSRRSIPPRRLCCPGVRLRVRTRRSRASAAWCPRGRASRGRGRAGPARLRRARGRVGPGLRGQPWTASPPTCCGQRRVPGHRRPRGRHHIEMRYRPVTLPWSLVITGVALAAGGAVAGRRLIS